MDTEIPTDSSSKKVALTIAIFAVIQALIALRGDSASDDMQLAATKASNQWAYFQSKSVKQHMAEQQLHFLQLFKPEYIDNEIKEKLLLSLSADIKRYDKEKNDIKIAAEKAEADVILKDKVGSACDVGGLLVQLAIVLSSVSILTGQRSLWYSSFVLVAAGLLAVFLL